MSIDTPSQPDRSTGFVGGTPAAWHTGGRGAAIRWTVTATTMGELLIAATWRGVCRVAFGAGEADVRARFPAVNLVRDDDALATLATAVVAVIEHPDRPHQLPLDVAGTAFQQAVWRELARVLPGETVSYATLAVRAGRSGAARAAGSACGANPVGVLIPCHRAVRADGTLGGYAWGLERKAALLAREGAQTKL